MEVPAKGNKLRAVKVIAIVVSLVVLMLWYIDDVWALLNLPGLFLVVFGVLGAGLLGNQTQDFTRFLRVAFLELIDGRVDITEDINEIVYISKLWHEKKIQQVEQELKDVANPFLRYAIELVIDNTPINEIHNLLRWRAQRIRSNEQVSVDIAQSLALYAPAFGMLGTILGLINMLSNLDSQNIDAIGGSMAIALLTTLYGIFLSNVVFKPIAYRLQQRIDYRVKLISLIMEGVELINHDRSPGLVYSTLYTIIVDHSDELRDGKYTKDRSEVLQKYRDMLGIKE